MGGQPRHTLEHTRGPRAHSSGHGARPLEQRGGGPGGQCAEGREQDSSFEGQKGPWRGGEACGAPGQRSFLSPRANFSGFLLERGEVLFLLFFRARKTLLSRPARNWSWPGPGRDTRAGVGARVRAGWVRGGRSSEGQSRGPRERPGCRLRSGRAGASGRLGHLTGLGRRAPSAGQIPPHCLGWAVSQSGRLDATLNILGLGDAVPRLYSVHLRKEGGRGADAKSDRP